MQYIQLSDKSYILPLSGGLRIITLKAFNFHKIKKLITKGTTEEELIPLLVTPPLPNGLYEAYRISSSEMMYIHTNPSGVQQLYNLKNEKEVHLISKDRLKELEPYFIGVYASFEDLVEDWPEYLI